MAKRRKIVVVAMSGGVDSSTAAYLLKEEGFDVVGVTMDLFGEASKDVSRIADNLGIRHETLDMSLNFKQEIMDYFVKEYLLGRTPNPCVKCNKSFKFGYLMDHAFKMGADFFATGHYARINKYKDRYRLLKGIDESKDQSYFLFKLGQVELSRTIFPLGGLTKTKVKAIAEKKIRLVRTKESQEICFIEGEYADFLKSHCKGVIPPEGDFVDTTGKILGRHKGIYRYTIGQRRGLGISHKSPLYVLKIDASKNSVILGENSELYGKEVFVSGLNWIKGEPKKIIGAVKTKIRYKTPEALSKVEILVDGRARIIFSKPQRGITPGQAAVFYRGEEVLGGGWISS